MRRIIISMLTLACALATTAPGYAGIASEEGSFAAKVNYSRRIREIRTLTVRTHLSEVARRHSQRMASRGSLYHNGSLAEQVDGAWRELGENVGRGWDVTSIHKAFMNSDGHRDNILYSRWDSVGVGVAHAADGRIYVTQVFADY